MSLGLRPLQQIERLNEVVTALRSLEATGVVGGRVTG